MVLLDVLPILSLKQTLKNRIITSLRGKITSHYANLGVDTSVLTDGLSVPMRRAAPRVSDPNINADARGACRVLYVSAIALQLAPRLQNHPELLANQLMRSLSDACSLPASVTIAVSPEGWITFEIPEHYLVDWLERTLSTLLLHAPREHVERQRRSESKEAYFGQPHWASRRCSLEQGQLSPSPSDSWIAQYTHARCCSWLRILQEVTSGDPLPFADQSTVTVTEKSPLAETRLDEMHGHSTTCESAFRDKASRDLLLGLVDSVDDLCEALHSETQLDPHPCRALSPSSEKNALFLTPNTEKNLEKWLVYISHQALNYQAKHPIVTVLQMSDRPTVEAHRLFIQVTQQWLRTLLVDALSLQAPTTL